MGKAGYVIGAILVIAMAVFIVYMVPSSISANVSVVHEKSGLLGKEVTLDAQWVGYNVLHQQLFTINEYINYSTNCLNHVSNAVVWINYNSLRYYTVLAMINKVSTPITTSIGTPVINIIITTGNYVTINTSYTIQLAHSFPIANMNSNVTIMPSYVNYTLSGPGLSEYGKITICH